MPELPEVETTRRALVPLLKERVIRHVELYAKGLRTPFPRGLATHLAGAKITTLTRRAKYILITLDTNETLIVHLGMTGGFFKRDINIKRQPHDHVIFILDNGDMIAFHDPRRFGQIDLVATKNVTVHRALAELGPEPLDPGFTPNILADAIKNRKTSIKTALLNQNIIAGLGNIYASEALFYAHIHPERAAHTLTLPEIKRLHTSIQQVLNAALAAGGSTLRDYRHPDGELGFFQDQFAVYNRPGQKCPGCSCNLARTGGIKRIVQGGRSTYFCPQKQK